MPVKPAEWRRNFCRLYTGQAFSILSSSAVQFAIIWWITVETESAIALTIASVVGLLPQAIIGMVAGVWIDRFDRKKIMIVADSVVAISSLVLSILFFIGLESMVLVYVVLFVRAIGETFHKPALQALIPEVVPDEDLTKAGGLGQMVNSACTMLGPMFGALVMSITTLNYALLIDVVGALVAVAILASINLERRRQPNPSHLRILKDMKQGVAAFWANKGLRRLAIPMFLTTIIFVPMGTLLPLMVRTVFNGTAWHNGVVQILFSVGMLVSAAVIGVTGGLKNQFSMISLSMGLLGVCALVGGALSPAMFVLFSAAVFFMGMSGMQANIPFTAYVQRTVPNNQLGKVLSLITSTMSFAAPVGMFIAGPLAETIGIGKWMRYVGMLMIGVGVFSYLRTRSVPGDVEVCSET